MTLEQIVRSSSNAVGIFLALSIRRFPNKQSS